MTSPLPPHPPPAHLDLHSPPQDAPWPGQLIGLSGGFSWLNEYGAVVGKTFPPGNDYGVFDRITDAFNVNTEYTVPEMALALGALAVLTG